MRVAVRPIPAHNAQMYWIQYLRTSIGAWTVVTDISAADDHIIEVGVQPSCYSDGIDKKYYSNDAVSIYALDHQP